MKPTPNSRNRRPTSPKPASRRPRRARPTDRPSARPAAETEAPVRGADRAVRLQKLLAAAGLGSRRQIEEWIVAGRLSVAGRRAVLGQRVSPDDPIQLDGRPLVLRAANRAARVLAYHKPVGQIVSRSDPGERASVFAGLPRLKGGKWIAIGRLDLNTSGLLLFTDSGELANRLMHPRYGLARGYAVRVRGMLDEARRRRLLAGIRLEDGVAKLASLSELGRGGDRAANRWYQVTIHEGRYREVRRLLEAVGCPVSRLIRTRFGPISLARDHPTGAWRELTRAEVSLLWEVPAQGGAE